MKVWRAAAGFGIAVLGSQAGHLLAYQVRFAGAAQQIQSSGAHWYFPALTKTFAGFAAAALLACLFLVGLARVIGRHPKTGREEPSLLRLVAALFTLQLAFFVGQERLEAHLAGTVGSSGLDLVLWGTVGQLPASLVGALALRWLFARVGPAVAELKAILSLPARQPAPAPLLVVSYAVSTPIPIPTTPLGSLTGRGPPLSSASY